MNAGRSARWFREWRELVFLPRRYFREEPAESGGAPARLNPIGFYLGAQALSLVVALVTSVLLFLMVYSDTAVKSPFQRACESITTSVTLIGFFIACGFVALVLTALFTFAVARIAGSKAGAGAHFGACLRLGALDAAAAMFLPVLILLADAAEPVPAIAALAVFLFARAWGLVAGFHAMRAVHRVSEARQRVISWCGLAPAVLVFWIAGHSLAWTAVVAFTVGFD